MRTIFNVGLEDWLPEEGIEYDLIWTQWCLGHLTDNQLIDYLKLCNTVLRPGSGIMVIKENLSTGGVDVFDDTDSSVTRLVCAFPWISNAVFTLAINRSSGPSRALFPLIV